MGFIAASNLKWNGKVIFNGKYKAPDSCPHCKKKNTIEPEHITEYPIGVNDVAVIVSTVCANCDKHYIVIYQRNASKSHMQFLQLVPMLFDFGNYEPAFQFSPVFAEVHRQAEQAYQMGLHRLAGCGYRVAAEILVKDYAIGILKADEKDIADKKVAYVLDNYFEDIAQKGAAKIVQAVGNDYIHYVDKHESIDIETQRKFYQYLLTLICIQIETQTNTLL